MTSGGDFLSGFSGGNTQKPLTEQNKKPVRDETSADIKRNTEINVAENKKIADKIVAEAEAKEQKQNNINPKPPSSNVATRPAQSASSVIKAPEHVVTRDKSYNKRTIIKAIIIGLVAIAVALIAFLIFRMMTTTEVPNFVGQELRQAELWQIQGGATVVAGHEYNLEFNEGIIFEQSIEPGETVTTNSVLNVTVSRGPNMNEIIDLPDFMEMTRGQITTWMNDNRMRSVNFTNEASAEIGQNHVIRVEFPPAVDPDNFRRSDSVTIFVSTGPASVQVPNFVGDTDLEDVEEFLEANTGIQLVIEHEEHETAVAGTVLRQNPARGTRMSDGDTLTIVLSKGDPIIVPNWASIRRSDAEDPIQGLNFRVQDRFNATLPFGRFISQSVPAGTQLFAGHERIEVVYSLGRPWIPDLRTRLENVIDETILDFNDQGAPITREIRYWDHWEPRGTIIYQNIYNQFAALNAHLIFYISRGNLDEPEDPEDPVDPPMLEDVWEIICDSATIVQGESMMMPITVMLNGHVITNSPGISMSVSHGSWISASLTHLFANTNVNGILTPTGTFSVRVHVMSGGRSIADTSCSITVIAPGTNAGTGTE